MRAVVTLVAALFVTLPVNALAQPTPPPTARTTPVAVPATTPSTAGTAGRADPVRTAIVQFDGDSPSGDAVRVDVHGTQALGDGRTMVVAVRSRGVPSNGALHVVFALRRGNDVLTGGYSIELLRRDERAQWPALRVTVQWADFNRDGRPDPLVTVRPEGDRVRTYGLFSPPDPPADEYWSVQEPVLVLSTAHAETPEAALSSARQWTAPGPIPLAAARALIERARRAPQLPQIAAPGARAWTFQYMENPGHVQESADLAAPSATLRPLLAERVLGLRCDRQWAVCHGSHRSQPSPTYWMFVRDGRNWRVASAAFYSGE